MIEVAGRNGVRSLGIIKYIFVLFVKTNEDPADEIIETESDEVVEAATNATLEPEEKEEEKKKEEGEEDDKEYDNDEGLCPYLEKKMLTRSFFLFSDFMTGLGDYIIKKCSKLARIHDSTYALLLSALSFL